MPTLTLELDDKTMGKVSDGFHTFDELYEHRCSLFLALIKAYPTISWYSDKHDDGSAFEGWFIAGIDIPEQGTVTYHLPNRMKGIIECTSAKKLEKGKPWDGHTPDDVIERIKRWTCGHNSEEYVKPPSRERLLGAAIVLQKAVKKLLDCPVMENLKRASNEDLELQMEQGFVPEIREDAEAVLIARQALVMTETTINQK